MDWYRRAWINDENNTVVFLEAMLSRYRQRVA